MLLAHAGVAMALTHLGTDLAIDLGTANTCVYAKGRGVILNEPSLIAFNTVSGVVEAVGGAAREMLGRSPGHLRPVWPIKDGVIADFDATEKMLAHFIRKTHRIVDQVHLARLRPIWPQHSVRGCRLPTRPAT